MKFIKKNFLENLVLVTGTHTSGKSMVSPIVASLSNIEILRKIYYLDQLSILYNFNKLNKMNNMSDKIHFSFRQIHPKNIDHNFPIGIIQRKNILKSVRLHKIFILYILAVAICLAVFS